ncbi:MAG TPA: divergent polysaccharide deacetylase family protein [Stellaceae bacterium]
MDQQLESFVNLLNKSRAAHPPAGELSHLPNWAQRALAKLPEPPPPPRRSLTTNGGTSGNRPKSDIAVPPALVATPPVSETQPAPVSAPAVEESGAESTPANAEPPIILDDAPVAPIAMAAPPSPPEIALPAIEAAPAVPEPIGPEPIGPEATVPEAQIAAAQPTTLTPSDLTAETREKIDAIPALADMFAGPLSFDPPAQPGPAKPLPVAIETWTALPEHATELDAVDIAASLPAPPMPSPEDLPAATQATADVVGLADDPADGRAQDRVSDNVVPMPARRRPLAYVAAAAAVIAVVALVMGGYWYTRQPGFAFIANTLRSHKVTAAPTPPMVAAKTVPSLTHAVPPDGVSASGNAAIAPVADATPQSTVADATPQSIVPPAPVIQDPPNKSALAKVAAATPALTMAQTTAHPAAAPGHSPTDIPAKAMVASVPAVTPVAAPPIAVKAAIPAIPADAGKVATKLAALPKAHAKPAPPVVKAPILAAAPTISTMPVVTEKAPTAPSAKPLAIAAVAPVPTPTPLLPTLKAEMPPAAPAIATKLPPVAESPAAQIAMLTPPSPPRPVAAKSAGAVAPAANAPMTAATVDEPTWLRNAVPAPPFTGQPQIAIVIDDLGLDRDRTRRAIALSGPVTLSFLAYASELPQQTEAARQAGHELIVHIPMEPIVRPKLVSQNAGGVVHDELLRRLRWDLGRFTGYVGVNNHMGNRLTTDPESIKAVIGELKARGLLFLDSRGGAGVAVSIAQRLGVPTVSRDIFLDDDVSAVAIKARLADLEKVARQGGTAIAIGHPHDQTLDVLTAWLASLPSKGLQLVPLTAIVRDREQHVAGAN